MATKQSTDSIRAPQTSADITTLAERLVHHADTIRNPAAAKAMGDDLREAARIIEAWRVGIHECIEHTKEDGTRARLRKLVGGA